MSSFRSRLGDDDFFDSAADDGFDSKLDSLLRHRPELASFYRDRPRADLSDFPSLGGFFSSKFDEGPSGRRNFFSRGRPDRAEPRPSASGDANENVAPETEEKPGGLPRHNLRNTVDLGRKLAESSDELDKNKRSMSAPPEARGAPAPSANVRKQPEQPHDGRPVERIIPIAVEGRDEPLVNNIDIGGNFAEPRHVRQDDDDKFMNHDVPFQQHFGESFGSPRNHPSVFRGDFAGPGGKFQKHSKYSQDHERPFQKNFQEKPQQQPHRAQKPQQPQQRPPQQFQEQHFAPRQEEPPQQSRAGKPHKVDADADESDAPDGHRAQPEATMQDPIKKIQLIQNDVLALMTQVENFSGKTKKDKEYIYLDEMLTRNLLKLDVIDTEGKENIRLARKEAIKCIQQCIAVLENKAEQASQAAKIDNAETSEKKEESDKNVENKPMEQNTENVETSTKAILVNNVNMDVDEQNSNNEAINKCDSKTNNTSSAMETESSETK